MIITRMGSNDQFNTAEITISAPPAGSPAFQAALRVPDEYFDKRADFKVDLNGLADLDDDAVSYGQALGQALFASDGLGPDFTNLYAQAQADHKGLHVRLVVEPSELQQLHWERIYQPAGGGWFPLGTNANTPLSRWKAPLDQVRPTPVLARPLQMLVVIASPANLSSRFDLDPISAEERQKLRQNLDALGEVQATYLESGTPTPPTLEAIRLELAKGYHFVHFLCHGAAADAGTVLYLEKADGSVDPTNASRLVESFQSLPSTPALCFLAACESAVQDRHDAFLALGPALVQQGGVQAAVAMSDKIGLDTAQVFAGQFYNRLLVHGLVDQAVNEARALVRDRWDWGVPVLFSRIEDNQLLDFPIDLEYKDTLRLSGADPNTARKVLAGARGQGASLKHIQDIEDLIVELDKSQAFLAGLVSDLMGTGEDTETFDGHFQAFYQAFKRMYIGQTWAEEKINCKRIESLGQAVLEEMQPRMPGELYRALAQQVSSLSGADGQFIKFIQGFLEKMNRAMDGIREELRRGNVETAIQQKINFEEQAERTLRKGKKYMESMVEAAHGTRRA